MPKTPESDSTRTAPPQLPADNPLEYYFLPWIPRPMPTSLPPEQEHLPTISLEQGEVSTTHEIKNR